MEKVFKDNCEELGEVVNTAQPVVNNGVIVALKNGAVWTVAGTSYLSSLTIDETSKVIGTLLVVRQGDRAGARHLYRRIDPDPVIAKI